MDDNKFARKHPEIWKYIKFFIVGLVTSFPDLGSYWISLFILRALGVSSLIPIFNILTGFMDEPEGFNMATVVYSYLISSTIGYACAFVLNRKATFHADSNVALSTFLYIVMVVFTILVNGLVLGPFLSSTLGKLPLPVSITESLAKILCMTLPGVWTYPFSRFVVHRQRKPKAAEQTGQADKTTA